MTATVLVGSQWGDEGKGKMTDFLAQDAEVIVRYQGGNNAGHTIAFAGKEYKLHLIPSGIFFKDKLSVIGNGVVLNPKATVEELKYLADNGVERGQLLISSRAHVILPYHILLDKLQEESKGDAKVGTTNKGIGPAYMDKASRIGIRMADLLEKETFAEKLKINLAEKNKLFTKLYDSEPLNFDDIFEEYYEYGQQLKEFVTDTSVVVNEALDAGKNVLFEGAQGVMLDIDHGTYPFVTSSNPIAGGVTTGVGIGPSRITEVLGICKAYSTRVGAGPFPTELHNEIGDYIRETGHEYGTVTKRPRRIGWFDAVAMRHAVRVSGLTALSLNLLDVLTNISTIKIATGYQLNGTEIDYYPASLQELAECTPIYVELPGWTEDITGVTEFSDLPENAKSFLNKISELVGIPVATISVGPDREQTIIRDAIWK
ncbi:adenylosuccinate synthetase [Amylolactobacillus amylotrophicus DSM 20534]|uniref:Adenylosuccinate synthase n=3 Tax=Amylolactobacillus TaxID=2767876 RepID=A0A1L6XBW7_9LACO|nr:MULTISPECIES: adenylosuccinate synthase [Amylolactobacillus]APT18452.1 adenylosuccinate synthase [Amylolactobacillus amylophilus DSM 20533 = JCM 1125]KRK38239.1 adenylosuccinate synthetase [Amylolactobacillus amylotrophicus DSM 20534]KRM43119.1 adenylosuccinate synthetase [Amylolactobacillus amylophilus DSM 20533 = JCM 1125]GED80482.1 adenylosuccinate synthetase [Amylolactobacillus amylophilus]